MVAIASITLWELALLIDSGRVAVPGSVESFLKEICRRSGLTVLDISPEVAALTVQFPPDFPATRPTASLPPPPARTACPS